MTPSAGRARLETAVLTAAALCAFAGNSIFTRMAIGAGEIDALAFTAVRLATGALTLVILVRTAAGGFAALRGPMWGSALALLGYAAPFSLAYRRIGAAAGALVLFGTVQTTMIGWGLWRGERPGWRTWVGLTVSAAGLVILLLPGARHTPDALGFVLMVVAGISWAAYSLLGKRATAPLAANARAFLGAVPLALALVPLGAGHATARGLALAALSGAVTSALGYAIWYRALRGLRATEAAIAQLSVPVIAAAAAALLLGEPLTARLLVAAVVVLGGIALVFVADARGH